MDLDKPVMTMVLISTLRMKRLLRRRTGDFSLEALRHCEEVDNQRWLGRPSFPILYVYGWDVGLWYLFVITIPFPDNDSPSESACRRRRRTAIRGQCQIYPRGAWRARFSEGCVSGRLYVYITFALPLRKIADASHPSPSLRHRSNLNVANLTSISTGDA